MFDFPANPVNGSQYVTPTGLTFVYNGYAWIMKVGPWGGDVTLIDAGAGIALTPTPIISTGTVALEVPVTVAHGGTGATTQAGARTNLGVVNIAGDNMTGSLSISEANPYVNLRKSASGGQSALYGSLGANLRWVVTFGDASPESGGNSGSNYATHRYADNGTWLGNAFSISRATGNASFSNDLAVGGTTNISGALNVTGQLTASGRVVFNSTVGGNLTYENATFLYWKDTGGTSRPCITFWNDNNFYVGPSGNTHRTWLRGSDVIIPTHTSIGTASVAPYRPLVVFSGAWHDPVEFRVNQGYHCRLRFHEENIRIISIGMTTSGGGFSVWDETQGVQQLIIDSAGTGSFRGGVRGNAEIRSEASLATAGYLWVNGCQVINSGGNWYHYSNVSLPHLTVRDNLNLYGGTFYNGYGDGWLYFNGSLRVVDFQCQNNVNATGWLAGQGITWSNYGGWGYSGSGIRGPRIHSDGDIGCAGNVNCSNTVNGGYVYSSGDVKAANVTHFGGMYWQNDGGSYGFCPWGVRAGQNVKADNDVACYGGVFRSHNRKGGRFECPGWDYDWISPFCYAGGLYCTPDYSGGPVYNNDTWWSDARLKLGIRNSVIDALKVIMATPVRAWEWTPEGERLNRSYYSNRENTIGIVAQELQETIPVAVKDSAWDFKTLMIDWNYIQPYMFRAIQQLAELNAKLEARIAQLEAR